MKQSGSASDMMAALTLPVNVMSDIAGFGNGLTHPEQLRLLRGRPELLPPRCHSVPTSTATSTRPLPMGSEGFLPRLLEKLPRLEVASEPQRRSGLTLRELDSLPVRFR